MKRSLKRVLIVILLLAFIGCNTKNENIEVATVDKPETVTGDVQTETSSTNDTNLETTGTIANDIPDAKRGYGSSRFHVSADEDMKRLGVYKKLVVLCNYRAELPTTVVSKFNELLVKKYGCDFVVEFIGFESVVNSEYTYGEALYDIRAMGQQADLIFAGSEAEVNYRTLIEEDFLVELTDILKDTEDGQLIYEALPKETWDSVEYDGKIYGIAPLMNHYGQDILVCNKELAEGLGMYISEGFTFYDIGTMLANVSEELEKQGLLGCYYYIPSLLRILGYFEIVDISYSGHGIYAKQDSDGKWIAFNPLVDEEFVKLCKVIREYENKGWIASTDTVVLTEKDKINKGNFVFYIDSMIDDEQIVGNKINSKQTGVIDVVIGDVKSSYLSLKEINVTGIASWSQYQADALKLLRIMQTEPEICNLLAWGIEGEDYVYVDREVIEYSHRNKENAMGEYAFMINSLLTYPEYLEPDNKVEYYEGIIGDAIADPFMTHGIRNLDYLEIAEDYEALMDVRDTYYFGLLHGEFEDVDEAIAEALKLQKEAGIDELIDKVNEMFENEEA